jgi:hypothetical protein
VLRLPEDAAVRVTVIKDKLVAGRGTEYLENQPSAFSFPSSKWDELGFYVIPSGKDQSEDKHFSKQMSEWQKKIFF